MPVLPTKGVVRAGQTCVSGREAFLSDSEQAIQNTRRIAMKKFGLYCVVVLLNLVFGCATDKPYRDITVAELKNRLETKDDLVILDVRRKQEYESNTGHLPGAILIPVQELENRYHELDSLKNREIVAYCRTGVRSARASKFLGEKGFKVLNMVGGIVAWDEMKLDTVKAR
jgi:rhodanese-related sulfurtransferase